MRYRFDLNLSLAFLVLCLDLGCPERGWTEVAPMLTKRWGFAMTTFQSRCNMLKKSVTRFNLTTQRLVVIGGYGDDGEGLRSAEIYDPGFDTT